MAGSRPSDPGPHAPYALVTTLVEQATALISASALPATTAKRGQPARVGAAAGISSTVYTIWIATNSPGAKHAARLSCA
jgi:hypothetical protein